MKLTLEELGLTEEGLMAMSLNEIFAKIPKYDDNHFAIGDILSYGADTFSVGHICDEYNFIHVKGIDFILRTESDAGYNNGSRYVRNDYLINDEYVGRDKYYSIFEKSLNELIN